MSAAQNPLTPETPILASAPSVNLPVPDKALAIGAHPDDVDFGCGATLAKWADAGCEVSLVVCTDGSKGTWDETLSRNELVRRRQQEQRKAAEVLGAVGHVFFLDQTDGELESSLENRSKIARYIRQTRPNVVLGHDPWKRYRLHPDHRHAGWLATDGVVAARDATFFPEHGLDHHRPDTLLLWEADEADHVEDVTGFAQTKFEALWSHTSQHVSTMGTDPTGRDSDFRDKVNAKLAEAGSIAGVKQAELFKLIDDL